MERERIFSREGLEEMAKPLSERAIEAINRGDLQGAKDLIKKIPLGDEMLHHAYLNWLAILISHIGENLGEEALYRVYRRLGEIEFEEQIWNKIKTQKPGIKQIVNGAARLMRSHFGRFKVEEDDEKITFINDPCGSGGTLLRENAYEPPKKYWKIKKAQPLTFSRENFPSYCAHCAVVHTLMPIERLGYPHPVVVPPQKPSDPCIHYFYKDLKSIPKEYYERVGKSK